MKIVYLLIAISLLNIEILCEATSPLDWTDPSSGTKYDFSSLKKDPKYKIFFIIINKVILGK
jgi:hypothetical protein